MFGRRFLLVVAFLSLVGTAFSLNINVDNALVFPVGLPGGEVKETSSEIFDGGRNIIVKHLYDLTYEGATFRISVFGLVNAEVLPDLRAIQTWTGIDRVTERQGVLGDWNALSRYPEKMFRNLAPEDGRAITKIIASWGTGWSRDVLAYHLETREIYSAVVLQIYNIWAAFHEDHRENLSPSVIESY